MSDSRQTSTYLGAERSERPFESNAKWRISPSIRPDEKTVYVYLETQGGSQFSAHTYLTLEDANQLVVDLSAAVDWLAERSA